MFVILTVVCIAHSVCVCVCVCVHVHWTNESRVSSTKNGLRLCHFVPHQRDLNCCLMLCVCEMRSLCVPQQTFILTSSKTTTTTTVKPTKHCRTKICGPPKTSVHLAYSTSYTNTVHTKSQCINVFMHENGIARIANHNFPKILLKVNWIAADLWVWVRMCVNKARVK